MLIPAAAAAAETGSQSFTGAGEHLFVVPAGVSSVDLELVGGSGGLGFGSFGGKAQGGQGATAVATLAVLPGEVLYVEVGGNGEAGSVAFELEGGDGGYGGGGRGAADANVLGHAGGGGGGGASDVRTCSASLATTGQPAACAGANPLASRLVIAGGGGGGGGEGLDDSSGGAGGAAGAAGTAGQADAHGDSGGGGGGPGGPLSGGPAGTNSESENPAQPGVLGVGGTGGGNVGGGGGGGGGGLQGGGGGGGGLISDANIRYGAGGGGGGGASGVPKGVTGVSNFSTAPTAPAAAGSATFSWTMPAPTPITGAPQSLSATAAVLTGSVNPNGSSVSDCHFVLDAPPSELLVPCAQQVGAGMLPVAVSAETSGLLPGTTYTATLIAASAEGSSSGASVTFTTPSAAPGAGSGAASATTLSVSALKLSPTRFRRGRRAATIASRTARSALLPSASKISFALSAPATATLSFERAERGVLVGHRCSAPSARHRSGRRCTRYAKITHALSLPAHAGSDHVTFDGVLDGGLRLAPGRYRLSLGATAAGARAVATQHPLFTLLS